VLADRTLDVVHLELGKIPRLNSTEGALICTKRLFSEPHGELRTRHPFPKLSERHPQPLS
jgi:hypothetical protein